MTLLPSINSINLLPHAARHSTNAPKRKWLPLRNYKVHFWRYRQKNKKSHILCQRSPRLSHAEKDSSMAKIYLQWHPKVTQLDPFPSIIEKGNMCTMSYEGAHWKPSIQVLLEGMRGMVHHAPSHCMVGKNLTAWGRKKSHCMVGKNLRLQGGQQVSSINHTVHTNQWGTPNCAYWMGKRWVQPQIQVPRCRQAFRKIVNSGLLC